MKNNNIPPFILCSTPELARQVLEKIERESDLRWCHHKNPTEFTPQDYYPNMVLEIEDNISFSNVKFCKKEYGITNFTKAEDFLLSDETKIRLEELDNKLDKLINSDMTNKTWDNLAVGWLLENRGNEFEILSICGRVIRLSCANNFNQVGGNFTKEELIADGFKIKGASEQKPGLDRAIELLEWTINPHNTYYQDRGTVEEAIEMLKKLK